MDTNIPNNIHPFIDEKSTEHHFEKETWKDITNKLFVDVSSLVQREGQLIRTEVNEKLKEVKTASGSIITGGALLFVGLLCVAATSIILLSMITELWLASVIVTIAFLVVGGIMVAGGMKKLNGRNLKPIKSIEAFGEIRHSLQEKVHEITKH